MVSRFLNRVGVSAQQRIDDTRFTGYAGTTIKMHRAFLTMPLRQIDIASALVLPLAFDWLLLMSTGPLVHLWQTMLEFFNTQLGFAAITSVRMMDLGPVLVAFPNLDIGAAPPTPMILLATFLVTLAVWLGTLLLNPDRFLPVIYFLRALVLVMWTALLYFYFFPGGAPNQLTDYMSKSLAASYVLMALVPWLHGVALYIFDFSLVHKVGVTVLTLLYLAVFVPFQYMLQLIIFHFGSILFFPLGFMAFGAFLDVFIIVALYGWGMTWSTRRQKAQRARVF